MNSPAFNPGVRLSVLDLVILIVGAVASAVVYLQLDARLGLAIAFVVGHFFLFCNVLRMRQSLELVWAAAFASLAVAAVVGQLISWHAVFAIAGGVTLVVALIEIRLPSYHGFGWHVLNPGLPEQWNRSRSDG